MLFQSTPSLRKVTFLLCTRMLLSRFQSTPSLRKVTVPSTMQPKCTVISIHTFLAEGDGAGPPPQNPRPISIHTFLAEGDLDIFEKIPHHMISIHTFLAEGDFQRLMDDVCDGNFNPHLPRGR